MEYILYFFEMIWSDAFKTVPQKLAEIDSEVARLREDLSMESCPEKKNRILKRIGKLERKKDFFK